MQVPACVAATSRSAWSVSATAASAAPTPSPPGRASHRPITSKGSVSKVQPSSRALSSSVTSQGTVAASCSRPQTARRSKPSWKPFATSLKSRGAHRQAFTDTASGMTRAVGDANRAASLAIFRAPSARTNVSRPSTTRRSQGFEGTLSRQSTLTMPLAKATSRASSICHAVSWDVVGCTDAIFTFGGSFRRAATAPRPTPPRQTTRCTCGLAAAAAAATASANSVRNSRCSSAYFTARTGARFSL
mmetsp:Transcript_24520/g.70447  ORF Transcript_24520/g.70447 Transcript_24520/m.70447 type:complete len:246 (-) Transcript_24520:166-903(-)